MSRCKNCREKFEPRYFLQKFCQEAGCKIEEAKYQSEKLSQAEKPKNKPISKVSQKRKAINKIYETVRIEVLSEAKFKCFIEGCNNVANTIEHTAGRLGFYDDWARDNNISLIIDKRFLKACCFTHNGELENNPELSKKYQLSKIHGGKKL
jgi:hypothetical protein